MEHPAGASREAVPLLYDLRELSRKESFASLPPDPGRARHTQPESGLRRGWKRRWCRQYQSHTDFQEGQRYEQASRQHPPFPQPQRPTPPMTSQYETNSDEEAQPCQLVEAHREILQGQQESRGQRNQQHQSSPPEGPNPVPS